MTSWGKKRGSEKGLPPSCEQPAPLPSCSRQLTERWKRMKGKQMAESVCLLLLGYVPCSYCLWFYAFFFIKGCYSLACRGSPLPLGTAALCWLHSGTAEACVFPIVGLSPSEQLQTPGHVVHHLLLTHDGQDSAGARLNLPKNKRVWLIAWILSVMPEEFAKF